MVRKNLNSVIFRNRNFFSIKFFKIIIGIIKFNFLAKINEKSFLKIKIDAFLKNLISVRNLKNIIYTQCVHQFGPTL